MSAGTAVSAVFSVLGLATQALQARQTMAAGRVAEEAANVEARNRRLQGRVEAVEAKEKGNEILRRTKAALASNIAGGYASGVIPTVGSVQTVSRQQVLKPASLDVGITEMDTLLATEKANREARYLEYQGQMAKAQARTQALAGIASSLVKVGISGAFDGLSLGGGSGYSASAYQGVSAAGTRNVPLPSGGRVGPAFGG